MQEPKRPKHGVKGKSSTEVLEKDDTELRLEKALFGDDAGFLNSLTRDQIEEDRSLVPRKHGKDDESDEDDADGGLSHVADEDLFFLDTGADQLTPSVAKELERTEKVHGHHQPEPVWHDSDDDRITVSLASNTRLRKLRDTEDDDVISGREYIQRLRRQYERLHPTPEWVTYARKRRKLSSRSDDHDAMSDSDVSMDENDSLPSAQPLAELLRTAGSLTRTDNKRPGTKGTRKLRPEVIDIQRCKDVASSGPSSVDTLQFHPYYPLLLAAGPSSTVTLYHISPQPPNPNPILTSLHLKGTPLHTAAFCRPRAQPAAEDASEAHDQTKVFLSSRRRYFHTWSLSTGTVTKVTRALYGQARKEQRTMEAFKLSPCGRYMGLIGSSKKGGGSINVLSTETLQWVCSCRIDSRGGVADFAWWRNGDGFAVVGKNGEVSEYDIEARRVVLRWMDDGAVGTTVIALGGDSGQQQCRGGSRWVAVGSSSGVVNLYDRRGWMGTTNTSSDLVATKDERPKPARMFDQLTTPISHLEFSQDGQMLVMTSRWKKNALRLAHLPSCTLYRNWPTDKTPLGRISAAALSPDGSYLAVGNEQGKIRLWEIRE
ncbi:putative U3 small nucleolar RNA-associated protein [Fonsecaea pedrosoi]|nr:putative U3 small nucleolar RNA-associated protein [Fonsecaea pedrosoi]